MQKVGAAARYCCQCYRGRRLQEEPEEGGTSSSSLRTQIKGRPKTHLKLVRADLCFIASLDVVVSVGVCACVCVRVCVRKDPMLIAV